ncbi:MAG: hypothetical protein QXV64_03090 [Candidatus Anstonellaceae archaeon]
MKKFLSQEIKKTKQKSIGFRSKVLVESNIDSYSLQDIKNKILSIGHAIFDSDPKACEFVVKSGSNSCQMLLELMSFTDKELKLHIPSTAVGLARKIVANGDKKTIEFFAREFLNPASPFDHIFHVLKDSKDPVVYNTFKSKFEELNKLYLSKKFNNLTPQDMSYLRFCVTYLAKNGNLSDAMEISKLLSMPSNQIRVLAGTNLINFSFRKEISTTDKLTLAKNIFFDLEKSSNFFASKLEVLEKGNFGEVLDNIFSCPELFNQIRLGKTLYYSILERFFSRSEIVFNKVLDLIETDPMVLAGGERFKIGLTIILNNLKKDIVLDEKKYKQIFDRLEPISLNENVNLELRKKIALLFYYFPKHITRIWKTKVYEKSIDKKNDEFYNYVYTLSQRPDEEKKVNSLILIVEQDTTFASILKTKVLNYLYSKNLSDISIAVNCVDSSFEAKYYLGENDPRVVLCFLSEKISLTSNEERKIYKKNKTFEAVLDFLSKQLNPPPVVLYHSHEQAAEVNRVINLYSNISIRTELKSSILSNVENILKNYTISRIEKKGEVIISQNIFDYLNHPIVKSWVEEQYGPIQDSTYEQPFGKNVLVIERGNQAMIQLKEETQNPRIRFLVILPSTQTALLDKSGLKEAYVEHLGGINLGSNQVSKAAGSLEIYYDIGGKKRTGILKKMIWYNKNKKEVKALSRSDYYKFIDQDGNGALSYFVNTSPRTIVIKLYEYL